MAGGSDFRSTQYGVTNYFTDSVLTLLPKATAWTKIGSLPRKLYLPAASVVSGKMRLVGGIARTEDLTENDFRREVIQMLREGLLQKNFFGLIQIMCLASLNDAFLLSGSRV